MDDDIEEFDEHPDDDMRQYQDYPACQEYSDRAALIMREHDKIISSERER